MVMWCELYPRDLKARKQSSKLKKPLHFITILSSEVAKNPLFFLVAALWFSATQIDIVHIKNHFFTSKSFN